MKLYLLTHSLHKNGPVNGQPDGVFLPGLTELVITDRFQKLGSHLPSGFFGKSTTFQWRNIYSVTLMVQVKHSGSQNQTKPNHDYEKGTSLERRGERLGNQKHCTHVNWA